MGNIHEAQFPFGLRNDDAAKTYTDDEGAIYLLPVGDHDYLATQQLIDAGLSDARVIALQDNKYVAFGENSDLVSLRSILNASLKSVNSDDVLLMLRALLDSLRQQQQQLNAVVEINTLDAVAFDQFTQRIEYLPPYKFASSRDAVGVFNQLHLSEVATADSSDKHFVDNLFKLVMLDA